MGDGEGEDIEEAAATSPLDEIKNNRQLKKIGDGEGTGQRGGV